MAAVMTPVRRGRMVEHMTRIIKPRTAPVWDEGSGEDPLVPYGTDLSTDEPYGPYIDPSSGG